MDDFTKDKKIKMSEENLWLVHGRDDVSYKESWAQRRLLEKKNARKRKQEEAAAALKNIDLPSSAKKASPVKSRYPLSPKTDNDQAGAKLPPVAKPRTDRAHGKRTSPRKRCNEAKSPGRDLEEILDTGRKSQIFASSKQTGNSSSGHKSNAIKTASNPVQERKSRLEREPRTDQRHAVSSRPPSYGETQKDELSSGSISDRRAIFENASNNNNKNSPSGLPAVATKRDHSQSNRHDKSYDDTTKYGKSNDGSSRLSATKLKKTSTRKDSSLERSGAPGKLTPKLDRLSTTADESCDFNYDDEENPFDISSILRAANEAGPESSPQPEFKQSAWNVLDYMTEDSPKVTTPDRGNQRQSMYSNCGDEETLSGFAKEIAKKRKAIKSPYQEESLRKIDANLDEKKLRVVKDVCKGTNEIGRGIVSNDVKMANDVMTSKKTTPSKHGTGKEEKRKAPKCPSEEGARDRRSEQKKRKAPSENRISGQRPSDYGTIEKANTLEKRASTEAPPKPPRKGKLSVQGQGDSSEMNQDQVATWEPDMPVKNKEPRAKKEERKRGRKENAIHTVKSAVSDGPPPDDAGPYHPNMDSEKDAEKWRNDGAGAADIASSDFQKQPLPEIQEDTANNMSNDLIFSPNSKSYKSVRERKSTNKKKMRRSMSFSEGQITLENGIIPVIHKSGYNEEASSKYNVITSCATPEKEKEKSVSDKIKELLDYAVSQQNIVIQASQALNLSLNGEEKRGCPEIIEGERLLLLATQRRTACLEEVEKVKQDGIVIPGNLKQDGSCLPCKAKLVISEIKLPLNGDFLVALRGGRMDLGVFHFVVLIQYGPTQIHSTKVRCTYDELSRNFLTFKDKIVLKDVTDDFELTVKVFGMHTKRATDSVNRGKKLSQSKESPSLMKNVFSSFTPRRRVNSADDSPVRGSSPKPVFRSTNFTAVGNAKINLSMISAGKFVLHQVPKNCPLEGFVELQVDCEPEFTASARGFLTLLEEVGGFTAWNRRWCVMQGDLISFWRFPDEEDRKPPIASIDLRMCSNNCVDVVPRMECSRPNTFELLVKRPVAKGEVPSLLLTIEGRQAQIKHWVSADNKEDRMAWMQTLNCQLSDSKAWSSKKDKSSASKHRGAVPV